MGGVVIGLTKTAALSIVPIIIYNDIQRILALPRQMRPFLKLPRSQRALLQRSIPAKAWSPPPPPPPTRALPTSILPRKTGLAVPACPYYLMPPHGPLC